MTIFADRVKVLTGTHGTGAIDLGAAVAGYQSFASGGITDGASVRYVIEDGTAWEIGTGVYSSAGPSMSRSLLSSSTDSLLNLSGGAIVFVGLTAADIVTIDSVNAAIASAVSALVDGAPGALDTLNELAAALANDAAFATTVTNALAGKAALSHVHAQADVTGLVAALALLAPLASPALTGSPTAPTPAAADNDTSVATTAFVQGEIASKAPLASPALTGNPTSPTPAAGDNDTSIATTAFVTALQHPGFVAGKWYYLNRTRVGAGAAGKDLIQLAPFYVPVSMTISDLGTRITTTQAANNLQLAVYASDATTKLPTGNAVAVTGSISTASAAAVSADITGANVLLPPGLYWGAVNHSGTTSIAQGTLVDGTSAISFLNGSATLANLAAGTNQVGLVLTIAQTYATWPDLTAGGFTEVTNNAGPALFLKAA